VSIPAQDSELQNHPPPGSAHHPTLLVFGSATSGLCRRVEGFLAQVLQRRHNHTTFVVRHIDADARPEVARRFAVEQLPTIIVVEESRVRARCEQPRGCIEIKDALAPWLQ
jgi:thioredoxin-like negative regulator of GroEL